MSYDSATTVAQEKQKVNSNLGKGYVKIWNAVTEFCLPSEFPLAVSVPNYLIHYLGDANKALFLAQLIYWNDRPQRDDGYFYKSKKDWEREIGLKKKTLERYEVEFVQRGWLDIKQIRAKGHFTNHYKLDMVKLGNAILHNLDERGKVKPSKSLLNREL